MILSDVMEFLKTVEWIPASTEQLIPGKVRLIDQTRLPVHLEYLETSDVVEIWDAIKVLKVRGAPAIGVCAAMGLVAAIQGLDATGSEQLIAEAQKQSDYLASSRPTAVNLFWALDRMMTCARDNVELTVSALLERLAVEANTIRDEDAAMCRSIGQHGVTLLSEGDSILTHCNAGSLATAEFGTALAPMYTAHEKGMGIKVYADETRPLLQGSRLTSWELHHAGIDVTLICDNMAASMMQAGKISCVMVGSDRIAGNGDVANKIGTYGVAVLAKYHNIPFYVLAPSSTFDASLSTGDEIPIEQRDPDEVRKFQGAQSAPPDVKVENPAFDVTPAALVTAIVCEKGILRPDYKTSIADMIRA
jgi:methylthioribose-1-phosphate isomerase